MATHTFRVILLVATFAVPLWAGSNLPAAPGSETIVVGLGELAPDSARQGWGSLRMDCSVTGKPLQIGDRKFAKGLGTHANSELLYILEQPCERFEAWVGVDAALGPVHKGTVVFKVFGDDKELFDSGLMHSDTPARRVSVPLAGAKTLKLVVTDGGDGDDSDHADWAEAILVLKRPAALSFGKAAYEVKSPALTVGLSADGQVVRLRGPRLDRRVSGSVSLGGCEPQGQSVATKLPGGGMSFTKTLADAAGHRCTVIERFTPDQDSVRWEVEIGGEGQPWSAPIVTRLAFAAAQDLQLWTAWSDPEGRGETWHDPLAARPFFNASWHYGNTAQGAPVGGDFISLPVAAALDPRHDRGVSLVLSPEDVLLNLTLGVSQAGQLRWTRTHHRLGGQPVRFEMHIVAHEADGRGALRWMTGHYPALFNPPNPRADALAGCGAYSGDERPIDADKFRKMGFKINWKLSDDFAYMGMFIPPVKSPAERWRRSCAEPAPPGKTETTSCEQQNAYGRWLKEHGFHLLNYFNVTEFGSKMKDREVPASLANDPELWKDPVAFAKLTFPGAIFHTQPRHMYYGAWLVDIGDPQFRQFMLEQARRHIELLPDTDGICIDRMDWLRCYNENANDGVSWVNGKPARSLFQSWQGFMEQLGPLMHRADKVIFGNTMTMRLELNRQLDGIYTEHGNNPGALNAAALMGLRKPVLAWTYGKTLQQPNPDEFFQRHLYLGVYPTAPYAGNHHCIVPEPEAERVYMDYGPLMDAMCGKKWVLGPHCVESSTPGVKVNLFEVAGGYALPVTFGGRQEAAVVRLKGVPGVETACVRVLHPGEENPIPVKGKTRRGVTELRVPLKRGCAMVLLTSAARQ